MTSPRGKVAAGHALTIGATATLIHLAVFLVVRFGFHIPLEIYTDKGDGASYKHMVSAILGGPKLDEYDSRVFPGYPLLIAGAHLVTRLSIPTCSLLVTFLGAGIAAALSAIYFGDSRVGWAVAFALPHAWINMSLAMSEAPVLALEMLGLMLARRNAVISGLAFGLAGLTRPVALFALLGVFFGEKIPRFRGRIWIAVWAAVVFFCGIYLLREVTSGPLHEIHVYANSPRAYSGQIFTWPFHSILWMTFHGNVGFGRWCYIVAHVILCIAGCVFLMRTDSVANRISFIWLSLNTLFILCIGLGSGAWGFNHFPRFMIPALPALAWSVRKFLPASAWVYILIGAGLFVMAILGVRACP